LIEVVSKSALICGSNGGIDEQQIAMGLAFAEREQRHHIIR
jgi:hypothetical protein